MFSNRYVGVKLLLALGTFFLMSNQSLNVFQKLNPDFRDCQAQPGRFHGKALFLAVKEVSQVRPDEFEILHHDDRIWVKTREAMPRPEVGDIVTLTGVFHRDNFIVAGEILIHKDYFWKRSAIFLVSAAVLGWLVIQFSRLFRFPTPRGFFITRT